MGNLETEKKLFVESKRMILQSLMGIRFITITSDPHMALDGKTPADKAGIIINGENKWKTLIQNASKK